MKARSMMAERSIYGYAGYQPQLQFAEIENRPYNREEESPDRHIPGYQGFVPRLASDAHHG